MLRGLYTATSAMQTTEKKIDVISNNLANVNTTGFKKDVVITETFPEVLLEKLNGQLPSSLFLNPVNVETVQADEAYQLSTSAGFFTAQTHSGISYSRQTSFAVDEDGYLKTYSRDVDGNVDTTYGNLILDVNGNPVQVQDQPFEIDQAGQVVVNGQAIASLVTETGPQVIGTINGGLRLSGVETNFSQGVLEETGNPLHMALYGNGMFQVQNLEGTQFYTRNGSFALNGNGEIVTSEGYYLLNEQGQSILVDGADFQVSATGQVLVEGNVVDQIAMADILNVRELRKHGEGYYYFEEGSEPETRDFQGEVVQGYLEGSNVNTVNEMVQMISAYRNYESNQKLVRAYDELLQRAANDIGKF